jgi:GNAT superfamily N-acetyltransferase
MNDIKIVDFRLDESAFVGELFHTCWRENHVFFRCPEMLRWYCFDNPYARLFSRGLTVKGAYHNEKLVGFFAYFPFLLNRYGKRSYGFHTAQWYTYPEYRGKSLGLKLLNSAWNSNRLEICFALGNNDTARAIFKKWNWPFIELWPRYLLVLDKNQCRRFLVNDNESLTYLNNLSNPRFTRRREDMINIEEPKTIKGLVWDNFYWNEFATISVGPAREEKYLLWRYEDIPLFKYRYLTASLNGFLQGLLIYRIEKVRDTQEKVVRIVEFMSTLQCSGPLLDRLIHLSLMENAAFVDFFCTSHFYASTLFERGFIQDNLNNHYILPFLFQPLDITKLTLDIAWKVSDTVRLSDQGWEGLYLTKGDGFHDVPN